VSKRAENEGFGMLDDFVCDAVHEPGIPRADSTKQGENEGIRVVEELVFAQTGGSEEESNSQDNKHPVIMITDVQRQRLEAKSGIRNPVTHKRKGGGGRIQMGIVEDEVYVMVNDYKHVIQKIKIENGTYWDGSRHAYRTGYYTYDAKRTRIVWGQYTQFLTEEEYKQLLTQARAKGWPIF
jgi:hypothetical protein